MKLQLRLLFAPFLATSFFVFSINCVRAQEPPDLDLGSSNRDLAAPSSMLGGAGSATIRVGGALRSVSSGDMVTPAELAALGQVVSTGAQGLNLDDVGRAVGGTLPLSLIQGSLTNLTVPVGVTAIGGNSASALNIAGNLTNLGTFLAIPNGSSTFSVIAANILNGAGATITTLVPQSLSHLYATAPAVDLQLISGGDIVNHGSIFASGTLSLSAAGNISNITQDNAAAQAVISGHQSTNIVSASGNIVNSGLIASTIGNINITSLNAQQFSITNMGGKISAAETLNVSQLAQQSVALPKPSLDITGGVLSARAISISAPATSRITVNEIGGKLNVTAGETHVRVNTGDLILGVIDLSGDPTFVNVGGSIMLTPNDIVNGALKFPGQHLAILAAGDVLADASLLSIDTSSTTGNGGNVFISAGLKPTIVNAVLDIVTLGDPSASGGSVRLPNVLIKTSSSAANKNGGSIDIIAHDNNLLNEVGGSGEVQISTLVTAAPNKGGNVLITAQAGQLILVDPIYVEGGVTSGSIELYTGEPDSLGLKFTGGKRVAGTVGVKSDPTHTPVDMLFGANVFEFNYSPPDQTPASVLANASGNVIFAPNFILVSDFIGFASRQGNVLALGPIAMNSGSDVIINSHGAGTSITFTGVTTIDAQKNVSMTADSGDINIGPNGLITGFEDEINLFAGGNLNIGDGVFIQSTDGNTFASVGDMTIGRGGALFTLGSNLLVAGGSLSIGSGNLITAGLLRPSAPTAGLLEPKHFTQFGGNTFIANGDLTIHSSVTSKGLDLIGMSNTGNIDLGSGNAFAAHGGNVAFYANKSLTGDHNSFLTRAVGTNNSFDGGVIQLSSGFSFNPFILSITASQTQNRSAVATTLRTQIAETAADIIAFSGTPDKPFTSPALDLAGNILDASIAGTNVNINSNNVDVGLVKATKLAGGQIDVSNSQLSLNKGAIFLESVGATASLSMTDSTFDTISYGVLPSTFNSKLAVLADAVATGKVLTLEQIRLDNIRFDTDALNQTAARLLNISLHLSNTANDASRLRAEGFGTRAVELLGRVSNDAPSYNGLIDTGRTESMHVDMVTAMTIAAQGGSGGPLSITSGNAGPSAMVRVSAQRSDLILFTTAGQVITGVVGGSEGASVIASQGTVISNDPKQVILHSGRMYANGGTHEMTITTDFGTITIPAGVTAAIVSEPGKPNRVVAIGGRKGELIVIRPRSTETREITLAIGEQATIELERDANAQKTGDISRMVVLTSKPDMKVLVSDESFYAGSALRLSGAARGAYERLLERLGNEANRSLKNRTGATPVALQDADKPSRMLAQDGTTFQQIATNNLQLHDGAFFLQARTNQKVETPFGSVLTAPDSLTAVEVLQKHTRVRLFDSGKPVLVSSADKVLALAPGQELLLQSTRPTKAESLPDDGLARRNLTYHHVAKGVEAVLGEFSIYSALTANSYMKPVRSPHADDDKRVSDAVLKMAIVLDMVTAKRGRYYLHANELSSAGSEE